MKLLRATACLILTLACGTTGETRQAASAEAPPAAAAQTPAAPADDAAPPLPPSPAANKGGQPYEPEVGQDGKDVVWVPTSDALVAKMLDLAEVKPGDYVIDLGSGDGRTVIAAAKRGARARGIEFNGEMVALSKRRAADAGVAGLATFVEQDLFETDLSEATVITMFLLPQINLQLRPKLLDLRPGTRIVSNSFTMEEWEEDGRATLTGDDACSSWCTALLWIVPAKVAGTWTLPQGTLTLKQEFQMVTGTLGTTAVTGRVRGDEITFKAGAVEYKGRVNGNTIEGIAAGKTPKPWSATRAD